MEEGPKRVSGATGKPHLCFVISSHPPYFVDFNHILAFPTDFRYRNRFQQRWIEGDLQQHIGAGLVGTRVLLLLRDTNNNLIIPVRWGTIKTAQMIGNIAYFEYLLGDLVEYSSSEQVREREIADRSSQFAVRHPWLPGPSGEQLAEPAVFRSEVGNTLRPADAADLTAWGAVVAAVAHADMYEKIEFLKIVGLYEASGRALAPVEHESFVVKPRAAYILRIFQTVPRPGNEALPPHDIEVHTFPEHIIALPSKQQAVGKYDLLEFSLKIRALGPRESTVIVIPHNPGEATGSKLPADLRIPVTAERASRRATLVLAALAVLSLVLMFRPQLAAPLPVGEVRNLATIAFVLIVAGSNRTLAALWPPLPWRAER